MDILLELNYINYLIIHKFYSITYSNIWTLSKDNKINYLDKNEIIFFIWSKYNIDANS